VIILNRFDKLVGPPAASFAGKITRNWSAQKKSILNALKVSRTQIFDRKMQTTFKSRRSRSLFTCRRRSSSTRKSKFDWKSWRCYNIQDIFKDISVSGSFVALRVSFCPRWCSLASPLKMILIFKESMKTATSSIRWHLNLSLMPLLLPIILHETVANISAKILRLSRKKYQDSYTVSRINISQKQPPVTAPPWPKGIPYPSEKMWI